MREVTIRNPQLVEYLDGISDEDIERLLMSIFTIRGNATQCDPVVRLEQIVKDLMKELNGSTEKQQDELKRLQDIIGMNHALLDTSMRQNLLDLQEKGISIKQTQLPDTILAPILGALAETRSWIVDSASLFKNQDKVIVDVLREKMSKVDSLATNIETITSELQRLVGRGQGTRKGVLLEDLVIDYLFEHMKDCTVERISSSKQKGRMDLSITKIGMPDIAVDLKNGAKGKNLSSTDLEKFYRDMTTSGKHAILAVFNGCVTGKRRFHIEVHGKSICIILHSLDIGTDYSQIMMAVNVIWVLAGQLKNQEEEDGVVFGHAQMIEIQQNIDAFSDLLKTQRTHLDLAIESNNAMARNRMLLSSMLKQKQSQEPVVSRRSSGSRT